jgi:hypothetical protein
MAKPAHRTSAFRRPETTRMASTLSGVVHELEESFITFRSGIRIRVSSRVRPEGLELGAKVIVKARLQGAE